MRPNPTARACSLACLPQDVARRPAAQSLLAGFTLLRARLLGLCVLALLALVATPPARAQLPRDLIEEALDQNIAELEIPTSTLAEALMTLADKTGLQFAMAPDVAALMPRGDNTKISVTIKNASVRAAVGQVFDGLGLRMSIDGDKILLVPAPFLAGMGRPLTSEELQVVQRLATGPWSKAGSSNDAPRLDVRNDGKPDDALAKQVASAIEQSKAACASRQFDDAAARVGLLWRIDGNVVIFETKRDEIRRRLDRLVDLTYQREPLDRVLVDLGQRVGVTMAFEPGVLQRVSARERGVDLLQRGVSVRQTLERICGNSGLAYEVRDDGVRVYLPSAAGGSGQPNLANYARLSIEVRPGVNMDVFVALDQLPADLRKAAEAKLREVLGNAAATNAAKP